VRKSIADFATPIWIAAVAAGMAAVWSYESAAGDQGAPPPLWPRDSSITPNPDGPTLVMIAHPRCPCTRASLGELAELLAEHGAQVQAHVVLLRPEGAPADFADTDLQLAARAIDGVELHVDDRGEEAARFRASVSGHTLLYDARGELIFSGGITGARGHRGDNLGRARVAALLAGGMVDHGTSPVFGCALHDPDPGEGR
jgi:hypothetical protein